MFVPKPKYTVVYIWNKWNYLVIECPKDDDKGLQTGPTHTKNASWCWNSNEATSSKAVSVASLIFSSILTSGWRFFCHQLLILSFQRRAAFQFDLNAGPLISWRKEVTYISQRKGNASAIQLTWIARTERCLAPDIQLPHLLTPFLQGCFDWKQWEFERLSSSDWFFFKAVGEGNCKAWPSLQTKISMG